MKQLALATLLILLAGCCSVDHDQQAATAARRAEALERVKEFPDSELTPNAFRAVAEKAAQGFRLIEARELCKDEVPGEQPK